MAEFSNKERGVRFTLPDSITVRDQLHYYGVIAESLTLDTYERYWEAAKLLIENWECKKLPDIHADLGELNDPKITTMILWVGTQVLTHIGDLDSVSKN